MKRLLLIFAALTILTFAHAQTQTITGTGPTILSTDGKGGFSFTYPAPVATPPPTPVTIAISPATATVAPGASQQFAATVSGSTDTGVLWSLNGIGTISTAGLYTAPATVSVATTATVTATAHASSAVTISATVSLTASPAPPPPPAGTAVTACGQALQANTNYYLAGDIAASNASAICLTIPGPFWVLNLNGHKMTGVVRTAVSSSVNGSGIHVFNGTITCNDTAGLGCFYLNYDSGYALSAPIEVDHISWLNTGVGSPRNLMIDIGGTTKTTVAGPNIKVHDNISVSGTGTGNRIVNLQVQATAHSNIAYADFYNNSAMCQSTANACQGIVAYGLYDVKVHGNTLVNAKSATSEPPRAVICDQTDGCEIYGNTFDVQDGRAIRLRGTNNKNDVNSAHDNTLKNVIANNSTGIGAFHIGDPDPPGSEVENAEIYANTINATTGWVFMARGVSVVNIHDNTVNDPGTVNLMWGRSDGGLGPATGITVARTTVLGGGFATSSCQSGVQVNLCKSGTSSSCTVNNSGC